jgi:outer membrane protein TolC
MFACAVLSADAQTPENPTPKAASVDGSQARLHSVQAAEEPAIPAQTAPAAPQSAQASITIGTATRLLLQAQLQSGQATGESPKEAQTTAPQSTQSESGQPQPAQGTTGAPIRLTLQDAIERAKKNSVQFQAAVTTAGLAQQDKTQARNTLLPSALYNNSVIYTQSIGLENQKLHPNIPPVIFIANNAVHEYISQADVHEALDLAGIQAWRRAAAAAAVAKAQQEIAARGLVVTVVQSYFNVASAQQKVETAKRNAEEGDRFLQITKDLEQGGEAAHSDVVKAELQTLDRRRQLQEAQLAFLNARLDFAVLVFPDFTDNFEIADDLHAPVAVPTLAEVQQLAARDNPEVRAALEAVKESEHDVAAARAGYLPTLTLDYFYGIDASRFAVNTTLEGTSFSNVGSSIVGTLNIPVWNWGTTQSKVKQANLRHAQVKRELSLAQRRLLAEIQSLYSEANTASEELAGLQRSAQLAEESLRLVTLRYRNGEATVLEVVDAQTTFAVANAAYQDGAVRYRVSLANLQTLTGAMPTP